MKKILAILVVFSMCFIAAQAVNANDNLEYCTPNPPEDCAWDDNDTHCSIFTQVNIAGGVGTADNGNLPPVIKCKWEYDLDVMQKFCINYGKIKYLPCFSNYCSRQSRWGWKEF